MKIGYLIYVVHIVQFLIAILFNSTNFRISEDFFKKYVTNWNCLLTIIVEGVKRWFKMILS
jgi:hypothetical protein